MLLLLKRTWRMFHRTIPLKKKQKYLIHLYQNNVQHDYSKCYSHQHDIGLFPVDYCLV